jgi:hypothetical protein
MTSRARHVATLLAVASSSLLASCASTEDTQGTSDTSDLVDKEKSGAASQKWIYVGMLPKLDAPSITVSLKAHTARVTGLLPKGFAGQLPFYAVQSPDANGRTRVTVVYPVATGKVDPSTGKAPAGPGKYARLYAVPFTPTNEKAPWGGFPFMTYSPGRGLAFHGPITSVWDAELGEWEWRLTRGPVSHGCQRMQGEHVVELANLLGIDMSKPHSAGESKVIDLPVTVSTDYDMFEGHLVDVDYPALASVVRPKGDVKMFPTWDSNDFPRWVCAYDAKRPLDAHHCDAAGPNTRDPLTGASIAVPPPAWIGSACSTDADCAFSAGGAAAACLKASAGASMGFCSIPCQGYCPDKAGANRTFCASWNGGGRCMAKVGAENEACGDIPGTHASLVKRFVGSSGASAAEASVCTY